MNAEKTAREKEYKFVWIKNGKIFLRQKEGAVVITVKKQSDLLKAYTNNGRFIPVI